MDPVKQKTVLFSSCERNSRFNRVRFRGPLERLHL